MKTTLICPSDRPGVSLLSEEAPLSCRMLLGQSLLEYWLSWLACSGYREVSILADDRVGQVRDLAGDGARWGLTVRIIAECCELSPAQALLRYPCEAPPTALDHFPGQSELPLFSSYADWFAALLAWMPHAQMPDRVGVRQIRPGIWAGLPSMISPKAELRPPCWIGRNVYVGPKAIIGPESILEDGACIERSSEVARSYIGPFTMVGQFTRIADSLAWDNTLINWQTGSVAAVPDPFLLCSLRQLRLGRAQRDPRPAAFPAEAEQPEVRLLLNHLLIDGER
jgi:NDP-sugar pyrophosphorylase family protein